MKVFIVKQATDLQGLSATLLKPGTAAGTPSAAAMARVQALNPHADLQRLVPGTVLLLPSADELDTTSAGDPAADAFAAFSAEVRRGLSAAGKGARAAADAVAADRSAVGSVMRGAAAKRLVEADPVLKQQFADADAQAKTEATRAQADAKAIDSLQAQAAQALERLGQLLR